MWNKNKQKILVCMSGGVDSSVATALLVRRGYDVTGAFMVNYDDQNAPESCWRGDYQDALRVAAKLGIKLLRLDFVKEYDRLVLSYMYKEYEAGRTPNPDVMCNKFIKFGFWLEKARELGFDYIATGHYAQVKKCFGKMKLVCAKDDNKDQTYFLHQLNQEQLKNVLFPIGKYKKDQVRKLAERYGLPTAQKEESMGICFIGEVPMKEFLQKRIKQEKGRIVTTGGEVVGEHDGLAFYTIGERGLGLGKGNGRPYFVIEKNISRNELVVGYDDDPMLYKYEVMVDEVNWISGKQPRLPFGCKVRMRHRQKLQKCTVLEKNKNIIVRFEKAERAPTPGQFAVFYKYGKCLGGGEVK